MNLASIKQWITDLNVFENERSRHDLSRRRINIISTRFYLTALILCISTIIIHTAIGTRTKTISIESPTYSVYLDLYIQYASTLTCPCRSIAISYGSFVSISHDYHPVCSSAFVSDTWLNLLFNFNMSYFFPVDFRSSAFGQFQLLASFCSLLKRFIDDGLVNLFSNTFLATEVYSMSTLTAQSVSQSSFLYHSIMDETQRLFNMIRRLTHSNRLQAAMQTTKLISLYIFPDQSIVSGLQGGLWLNRSGDLCVCDSNPTCSTVAGFFDLFAFESEGLYVPQKPYLATLAGFVAGCYALESLLQSTLECLFDDACLALAFRFFPSSNQTVFKQMDMNVTRFPPHTSVHTLLNELFLEYWVTNTSFQAYFDKCSPISCSYTLVENNSLLFVLTTLLSLYGGLTVALRLIVPSAIGWWCQRSRVQDTTDPAIERSIIAKLRSLLYDLNIFKNARTLTDEFERRTAIISTRWFLFCLILCTITIAVYNITITQTHIITIDKPSQTVYERLYSKHAESLECPCSHIVAPYGSFLSISPIYHPVCSSLIVSDLWMRSITAASIADFIYDIQDFHIFGNTFFATLAMLCSLAETTINDAWYIFKQSTLVSSKLLSNDELTARALLLLGQFQSHTLTQFVSALDLIQMHTSNALSTIQGNVYLATYDRIDSFTQSIHFHWVPREWNNCSCLLNETCIAPIGFYTYPPNFPVEDMTLKFYIPQFFISCSAIQSVLESALICFFRQECLNDIQHELNSNISVNISALHPNDTKFLPESWIKAIVDQLMVERWNDLIKYPEYYDQCRPKLCTYRLISRDDFFHIISTLLSLFGGLTAALKLIIPYLVGLVRNLQRQPNTTIPIIGGRASIWQRMKNRILNMNIFDTEETWFDNHRRFEAIMATRVYVVLLISILMILTLYNSFSIQIQSYTRQDPSRSVFEELSSNTLYSSTLECPCQTIAIPYGSFVTIKPYFHQLCSSDFLIKHSEWIHLLYYPWLAYYYSYTDFRLFAAIQFRLLASFCHTASNTINNALTQFVAHTLINSRAQTQLSIETQANSTITQFLRSTSQTFTRTVDSIRQMMHGNGIVSATLSNWHFVSHDISTSWAALWAEPRQYGNCTCGLKSNCTSPAYIDQRFIRGFLVGCDPLEALLQSTLACLYDITCIFTIKYMYIAANLTMRPLNRSLSDPNSTVRRLLENLMVDRWETHIDYDKHYQACAPHFCTYSITTRPNLIFVITIIIGLFGGLNIALKMMVPKSVRLMLHIFHRPQNQVRPSTFLTNNT